MARTSGEVPPWAGHDGRRRLLLHQPLNLADLAGENGAGGLLQNTELGAARKASERESPPTVCGPYYALDSPE